MAPTPWLRVSHILWLACLLRLAPAVAAAGLYELNLVSDGPVTTGAEVNVTASLVVGDNSSLALPTDPHSYRFHWVHSPLLLTGKTDEAFRSTIRAVGSAPGDFPVSVWVTADDCQLCQPVARGSLTLSVTESIVGKLVITQNASLPWPSTYLTKTVLKTSFLLHDPSNYFKNASFLYSWDFEDGTQMVTEDSTVYYNRSIMGTFTVKLKVVAEWEPAATAAGKGIVQKTGHFSGSLKLQETLRGIQVVGPTQIQAFQELPMTLNFLGSPPLTVCWHLRTVCLPLEENRCHRRESVASTAYNMSTIFMEPGDYCFSIRAENVISKTHQYYRVQVWPSSFQPAVFAFPCATIITMMLALIMYMTLRNTAQQKDMVEVADFDFSPMSDKKPEHPTETRCCQMCCLPFLLETPSEYLEVARENHGLLPPLYKSVKTYTV
ncbi:transmembrane protein 130 isoform X2 [Eptesicus fuscus]|uniref:transmembrane protein 130 isoform X2 n=1 Tax=Eptesicus fuscus TaxID=29078 RepID=UPI00240476FF|nr:transmembrane protein 130 isoform X2 [Eptesicus fuscus]XP_054574181.1 transmembrane protein 130 isoform X2 [Eptesicus fuscus]